MTTIRKLRKLARVPEYTPIPQKVLDRGWNKAVHVENWPASYRFFYKGTHNGVHRVFSSKGEYLTQERLLYTKRYTPAL